MGHWPACTAGGPQKTIVGLAGFSLLTPTVRSLKYAILAATEVGSGVQPQNKPIPRKPLAVLYVVPSSRQQSRTYSMGRWLSQLLSEIKL